MGTTRIKVIDLASEQKEIKTSRKRAAKLSRGDKKEGEAKPENLKPREADEQKPATTEITEKEHESSDNTISPLSSVLSVTPSVSS